MQREQSRCIGERCNQATFNLEKHPMPTKRDMQRLVRDAREELNHAKLWLMFYVRHNDFNQVAANANSCAYWQGELNLRREELVRAFPKRDARTAVSDLLRDGDYIEAIKQYRKLNNCDLRAAKDAVDE